MSDTLISDLFVDQTDSLAAADWDYLDVVSSFWDVAFTRTEHDQLVSDTNSDPFWASTGVSSVIAAWNSAVYDDTNNTFYFFGGGHNNYGGNEVYSFDLATMQWSRVTDPSPVDFTVNEDGQDIGLPREGPISPHTYDGLIWNDTTQTFWLTSTFIGFGGNAPDPDQKAVWEFDPASETWTAHESSSNMRFGSSAYIAETGQILSMHNDSFDDVFASLFDPDGTETYLGRVEGLRLATTTFTHPETGAIYTLAFDEIAELTIDGDRLVASTAVELPTPTELNTSFNFGKAGYAYRPVDGKFYIWNGGQEVVTWDPATNDFEVIWNENDAQMPDANKAGAGKVFQKWEYIAEQDAFVGISDASEGMFVWKPGGNPADVNVPEIGEIQLDYHTTGALGVFVPLVEGDKNYDSSAKIWYRAEGASEWQPAMDLLRMRPDFNKAEQESPEGYAGSIFGLDAGQNYEIKLEVSDPDGTQGSAVQTLTATTKDVPARNPDTASVVDVYDTAGLENAIANADAGTVIQVNPGTYTLSEQLKVYASGTADNPVVIRGLDRSSTIIDAQDGIAFQIFGDHVTVEGLSITNTSGGIVFPDSDFITVRENYIQVNDSDDRGQKGVFGRGDDTYVVDNILEGPFEFGRLDPGGADRGIDVGGHNIEIAYNTLSGFLDAIAGAGQKAVGVEIHHNDVLWSTDNGIELDHGLRNISAHDNRLSNTKEPLSAQTVAGGPAYMFDNVLYNVVNSPLKIKPLGREESQGIYFVNNTIVKEGAAWSNDSGVPSQVFVLNNLFLGQGTNDAGGTLRNLSDHRLLELDYNAWLTDGSFQLDRADTSNISEASFADFQKNTPFAENSLLLEGETVFENLTLDFDENGALVFRDPEGKDFTLDAGSSAVDAGVVLANINDAFTGAAPDIGAVETGDEPVQYGARITMDPVTAPFATADTVYTETGSEVTFDPTTNDWDPNGDAIEVTAITQPADGSAVLNADGTVTYTPPSGYTGDVTFEYTLTDANGEQSTGSIGVRVTPPNDAPTAGDDSLRVEQDDSLAIATADLLANDSDPDGDTLSVSGVDGGAHGTVGLSGDTVTYTPDAGFLGTDSFTYTIDDGRGGTASGTVTVEVLSDGLVIGTAGRDTLDLSAATSAQIVDALAGRDTVIGSGFADEINGGADADALSGGGGDDTFLAVGDAGLDRYQGGAGTDRIVGSDGDDVIGLRELSGIEAIDGGSGFDIIAGSDYGGENWDFSAVTLTGIELIDAGGHHNTVRGSQDADAIAASGGADKLYGEGGDDVFHYSGAGAGIDVVDGGTGIDRLQGGDGDDVFGLWSLTGIEAIAGGAGLDTIQGSDFGRERWDFSGVEITGIEFIDPGGDNDRVVGSAGDDDFRVGGGNDTFDGGAGRDVGHFAQKFADYAVTDDGTQITVEALASDEGRDTLTNVEALQFADGVYRDGAFHAGEVASSVDEADAPIVLQASDDSISVAEDATVTFDPTVNDTLTDSAAIAGITAPAHGAVSQDANGDLVYTPDADYHGADSFTYTLSDADGGEATGTVEIDVTSVNDAPTAAADTARTESDTAVVLDVLANDGDPDGGTLAVESVTEPADGAVAINPDGTVTYTPVRGVTGQQNFTYTLSDGQGGSATGNVTIEVDPVPPVADPDTVTLAEDGSVTFDPMANDLLNPTSELDRFTTPAHGTVTRLDDGRLTYTPDPDFNGTDSFDYTLRDGDGNESTATVTLEVASVNDAPTAVGDSATTRAETAVTIDVLANDSDPDGGTLSVADVGQPDHGTVNINSEGTLTYTPNVGVTGVQSFSYTLRDGQGGTASASVDVDVVEVELSEVYGTRYRDNIDMSGADGARAIYALGGRDHVVGSSFDDVIDGGARADHLEGGAGDDTFVADSGGHVDGVIDGGAGYDKLVATGDNDIFGANALIGIEEIDGGAGYDVLRGSDLARDDWDFSDVLLTGIELIDPGGHADIVRGSQGDDRIASSGKYNKLEGEGGNDVFVYSGAKQYVDHVSGGAGYDQVVGGDGDDDLTLHKFDTIERIDGGSGRDAVRGSEYATDEWDFSSVELIDVELIDSAGHHDRITGSAGDDHIRGGNGNDVIDGGAGYDTVYFDGRFADYDLNQDGGTLFATAQASQEGTDTLTNVEALRFADGVYEGGAFQLVGLKNDSEHLVYDGV